MPEAQSALDIVIPEAESLVAPFRAKYDPSAADGMPGHVTIIYPFAPPQLLTTGLLDDMAAFFATQPSFDYAMTGTARFPEVLYLTPEPEALFRELILATADRFPDYQPYGGLHQDPVPHLTVAHAHSEAELNAIAAEFEASLAGALPMAGGVTEIVLHENSSGRWQEHSRFSLGARPV
jgi:2'-5' RNA ligase